MQDPQSNFPNISEFFSDKTVALTGATGFIGQLLIEKLLRGCPRIKSIVLFMRSKRGQSIEERLQKITELPIFSVLRKSQPTFSSKLIAVSCNLEKPGFGLDYESLTFVQNEVNIFFHSAATLRFNEHLRLSYDINTNGVRELLKLCRTLKNLVSIVHISTAYSYCNRNLIEEEVYPTGWDFDKLHDSMQWMTDDMITKLTPDILKDRPNTYTLTKAFGEEVVVKEGKGLPICIVRPSVIGCTYKEPIPGWCVNLNGPTGLYIAFAKGFLRLLCVNRDDKFDMIPADYVVNCIIAAAWKTGLAGSSDEKQLVDLIPFETRKSGMSKNQSRVELQPIGYVKDVESDEIVIRRKTIPIYHIVANPERALPMGKLVDKLKTLYANYPLDNAFRLPLLKHIPHKTLYRAMSFFVESLPAYIFDAGLMLVGQKPRLTRVAQRLSNTTSTLQYFIVNAWKWKEGNTLKLQSELSELDRKAFNFNMQHVDWDLYIKEYCLGTKQYILKEDPLGYPTARRHMWRLRILGWCLQFSLFMITWRFLVSRSYTAQNLWHLFMSLWFKFLRFFRISSTLHGSSKLFRGFW